MNFRDEGIIIHTKTLKENSAIITLFTKNHGLYSGVIRKPAKKVDSTHLEGNLVDFFWQARLHEHIGTAKCELLKSYSGILFTNKAKLYAFNSIVSLIKLAFHERELHNNFFSKFQTYLDQLLQRFDFREYILLELAILAEAGYGLQLDSCAITGDRKNLTYVSPKSGKAVSKDIGLPYKNKLLPFPEFLKSPLTEITNIHKKQAFALTTYFFNRYFFHNLQQPEARSAFITQILDK